MRGPTDGLRILGGCSCAFATLFVASQGSEAAPLPVELVADLTSVGTASPMDPGPSIAAVLSWREDQWLFVHGPTYRGVLQVFRRARGTDGWTLVEELPLASVTRVDATEQGFVIASQSRRFIAPELHFWTPGAGARWFANTFMPHLSLDDQILVFDLSSDSTLRFDLYAHRPWVNERSLLWREPRAEANTFVRGFLGSVGETAVFFRQLDTTATELWVTDGTAAGTRRRAILPTVEPLVSPVGRIGAPIGMFVQAGPQLFWLDPETEDPPVQYPVAASSSSWSGVQMGRRFLYCALEGVFEAGRAEAIAAWPIAATDAYCRFPKAGSIIARVISGEEHTSISRVDPVSGEVEELYRQPGGYLEVEDTRDVEYLLMHSRAAFSPRDDLMLLDLQRDRAPRVISQAAVPELVLVAPSPTEAIFSTRAQLVHLDPQAGTLRPGFDARDWPGFRSGSTAIQYVRPVRGGALVFAARVDGHRDTFLTDGRPVGTRPLAPSSIPEVRAQNGEAWFMLQIEEGLVHWLIQRYDQTDPELLSSIEADLEHVVQVVAHDRAAFLLLGGGSARSELWRTDGTRRGTRRLFRSHSGGQWHELALLGDWLMLGRPVGDGGSLEWRALSVREGGEASELEPAITGADALHLLCPTGHPDRLAALVPTPDLEPPRLALLDVPSGTVEIVEVPDTISFDQCLSPLADGVLFSARRPDPTGRYFESGLLAVRGGQSQWLPLPSVAGAGVVWPVVSLGELALFPHWTDELGLELWRTDGSVEGTRPIVDLFPGRASSMPTELTVIGNRAYFFAEHPEHGRELFVTDGTPQGTRLHAEIAPGPSGFGSAETWRALARAGSNLVFSAWDPDRGQELFGAPLDPTGIVEPEGEGLASSESGCGCRTTAGAAEPGWPWAGLLPCLIVARRRLRAQSPRAAARG